MADICNTLDTTIVQLLYKKYPSEDICGEPLRKKVFPNTIIQAVFDGISGTRLDTILSFCNSIYIPYKGSSETTRLAVNTEMRRKGLIVTFRDMNNISWTLRYKGELISDEEWQKDDNWEAWDFDSLLRDITEIIQDIFSNIDDYPILKEIIDNSLTEYIQEAIENGDIADMIRNILLEVVPNFINEAINTFFNSEEGKDLLRELIMGLLPDALSEFLEDIHEAIRDNERVTANALARHEQAIIEIQTQLGIH